MKVTYNSLVLSAPVIQRLQTQPLNGKAALKLKRNIALINDALKPYENQFNELIEAHARRDKQGEKITETHLVDGQEQIEVKLKDAPAFYAANDELLAVEIELPLNTLVFEDVRKAELSVFDLEMLEYLIPDMASYEL